MWRRFFQIFSEALGVSFGAAGNNETVSGAMNGKLRGQGVGIP
ncbi:MAG: hypothetical protein V8S69_03375 [Dakarella massiliensis]